jgi:prepilin-type N-terminal cleavage/methylation domain-containing protein
MNRSQTQSQRGFTLIELMVVIALIATMATIAIPRLMPLLVLTNHESGAGQLVGFGRAAMSHAALAHTDVFVVIDLDGQEYWAEVLPEAAASVSTYDTYVEEQKQEEEQEQEDDYIPQDEAELLASTKRILQLRQEEQAKSRPGYEPPADDGESDETDPDIPIDEEQQNEILTKQTETMMERFADTLRTSVTARARRVEHDESYDLVLATDENNPYRAPEDDELLDEEGEQLTRQELVLPFLGRTKVEKPLFLESVVIGENEYTSGTVEIELSPLGLDTPVAFYLASDDGDMYVIQWDPITGGAWYEPEWEESS